MEIIFETPENVTPGTLDGIKIRFPYRVIREGQGLKKDEEIKSSIDVTLSGTLLATWGLELNDLLKEIFGHVIDHIRTTQDDLMVPGSFTINPLDNQVPKYDPEKVPDPSGHRIEIDRMRRIGF